MTDEVPELHDARLFGLLDPVVEAVRGALPYVDRPAELADDAPVPTVRVRRVLREDGLTVDLDRHLGVERVASDRVAVDRLPLDRDVATLRRREHPAPTTVLQVRTGARAGAGILDGTDATEVAPPEHGFGHLDGRDLLARARDHRLVVVDDLPPGDPALTAALLLQLTAAGVACWCPATVTDQLPLLAPELRASLHADLDDALTDDLVVAARAAGQRRAAWTHHDLTLGWDDDEGGGWRPRLRPHGHPPVSVILVSRRVGLVPSALAMIAAQRGADLEVVVALHGDADTATVDAERQRLGLAGATFTVPSEVPFGAVMNAAVARSSAPMVLKWDDDDLYGPDHVRDLLIAHRQSGAELVGRSAEFVHLGGADETLWRNPRGAESAYRWLAGGTFLTPRSVLDDVGGYPEVSRAIDHHLKFRIEERGGVIFRTHGFGFVLRRHALGHTWEADDDLLRTKAVRTFPGIPPIVGLGDAVRYASATTTADG